MVERYLGKDKFDQLFDLSFCVIGLSKGDVILEDFRLDNN